MVPVYCVTDDGGRTLRSLECFRRAISESEFR
jgi:hypothetical protein